MKEPKEVTISISDRFLTIDLAVQDEDLIETFFTGLTEYVKNGLPIKVKQTYMNAPSDSVNIITKLISKSVQMDEWRDEINQLISVLRKG